LRVCQPGQIVIGQRAFSSVEGSVEAEGLPFGQHNDKHRFGEILREAGTSDARRMKRH
jgi:hypothetical protein